MSILNPCDDVMNLFNHSLGLGFVFGQLGSLHWLYKKWNGYSFQVWTVTPVKKWPPAFVLMAAGGESCGSKNFWSHFCTRVTANHVMLTCLLGVWQSCWQCQVTWIRPWSHRPANQSSLVNTSHCHSLSRTIWSALGDCGCDLVLHK